jgi:hypothetical protein
MADNTTLPGTGEVYASDDIGGVKWQRVKIAHGADGSATDSSAAAPFPVTITDLMAGEYEAVAASQTDQILGATGAVGDYLSGILIVPATTSPGAVSVKDGNGSAITIFTGGATSVSNLVPFFVPYPAKTVNATTPGWKVTTGANVSAVGFGNFT